MSPVKIQATEYPIYDIFSSKFVYTIPLYQRPYAWTTEQAGELIDDLIASLGEGQEAMDNLNPYFLGSIVLIKGDSPEAQVVDGQQRLSTLTILLATLRTLVPPDYVIGLTKLLYEERDLIQDTPPRYRLTLAKQDADFFKKYVQDEGGISELKEKDSATLSDSRKNIKENALLFLKRLEKISDSQRVRLLQFINKRCFLVVVSTPDLDSAYRIFSVLNDRGLDLSLTDILKGEIIGPLPDDQTESYTSKWEAIELDLGRDAFKDLFSHIRMIYRKAKLGESVIKEIREYVLKPLANPQQAISQLFIDTVLCPLADAFSDIKKANYLSTDTNCAKKVNSLFKWLNQIDNFDWIPPAILYLSRHNNEPSKLVKFFTDLERLAAGMMIMRSNVTDRIGRYSKLLTAIEQQDKVDLYAPDSPLQLTSEEQSVIIKILDGDIYLMPKIRLYVLLRLEAALADCGVTFDYPIITVEHVLPQNPAKDSLWLKWFPDHQEHQNYVHRLGNLVLLSHRKNSEARNYEFDNKKDKYFNSKSKSGVAPFVLTTTVIKENTWTPVVIEQRQKELIDKLKKVWRLEG